MVVPSLADDSVKQQCASAYEGAQELRLAGKLVESREQLKLCAREECPAFVESDCARWLTEVQKEMPSVVVAAKDKEGADTADVRVFLDGAPFTERVDGQARDVNPGTHTFRFELEGAEPVEKEVVTRVGHKNRVIDVDFSGGKSVVVDEPVLPAEADDAASPLPGRMRLYSYIAGGVGAAGIIGWAVVGLAAKGEQSDLEEKCAPQCTEREVDSVRTKFLIADISLGVGIAGLAAGATLFVLSMPKSGSAEIASRSWQVGVTPTRQGAFGSVHGRF